MGSQTRVKQKKIIVDKLWFLLTDCWYHSTVSASFQPFAYAYNFYVKPIGNNYNSTPPSDQHPTVVLTKIMHSRSSQHLLRDPNLSWRAGPQPMIGASSGCCPLNRQFLCFHQIYFFNYARLQLDYISQYLLSNAFTIQ